MHRPSPYPRVTVSQHASAVRSAIDTARAANEKWTSLETNDCMKHTTAATGARASFVRVTQEDVMLGLRIGDRLVIIDEADNKNSDIVRAVDGLLTKAKQAVDVQGRKGFSMSTEVEAQYDTRVSITVTPSPKGNQVVMYYERGDARERIHPIGVVNFFLG